MHTVQLGPRMRSEKLAVTPQGFPQLAWRHWKPGDQQKKTALVRKALDPWTGKCPFTNTVAADISFFVASGTEQRL